MFSATISVLIYSLVSAQPAQVSLHTSGACSPVGTGDHNTFKITCQGISDKLATQIVDLLNRLAQNQADAETVMAKLDGCIEGIKDLRDRQQPWKLTAKQKLELKRRLSGIRAKVRVHVVPTDRNASLMALDIMAALRDAGWQAEGLDNDFTLNPALEGIHILVDHTNFPEATRLQEVLDSFGNYGGAELDESKRYVTEPGLIVLAIGARPNARR